MTQEQTARIISALGCSPNQAARSAAATATPDLTKTRKGTSDMAKTEPNTIQLPDETASPAAALWRIVLSEYQAALAAYDAFGPTYHAACEATERAGRLTEEYQTTEREHDALADVLCEARNKLFLTPTPDSAALAFKMRTLCAYLKECDAEDTQRVEALAADVRSLFGVEE